MTLVGQQIEVSLQPGACFAECWCPHFAPARVPFAVAPGEDVHVPIPLVPLKK